MDNRIAHWVIDKIESGEITPSEISTAKETHQKVIQLFIKDFNAALDLLKKYV